jgi:endonuclease/exonuclease/phosphatase family metal-dependent hydrolase
MVDPLLSVLSWNIGRDPTAWTTAAAHGTEVLLLQEVPQGRLGCGWWAPDIDGPWLAGGWRTRPWSTAVAVRGETEAEAIALAAIDVAGRHQLGVSRAGSLAAATVHPALGEPITVVSAYACWEDPLADLESGWIYADASAHRIVSDLSALIGREKGHRIVVAGDWNILRGYGEGSRHWRDRYATVFAPMEAIGLPFVGPVAGRRPDPRPDREMPIDSDTTPTFWPPRGAPTRQLDFVFASEALRDRTQVQALNDDTWTRDHCPLRIEVNA